MLPQWCSVERLSLLFAAFYRTDYRGRLLDLGPESSVLQYTCRELLRRNQTKEIRNPFDFKELIPYVDGIP